MSHTSGKWKMSRSKNRNYIFINGDAWEKFAKVIVRMDGDQFDILEGVANARLISVAPKLLESLDSLVSKVLSVGVNGTAQEVSAALAAIAEARGTE